MDARKVHANTNPATRAFSITPSDTDYIEDSNGIQIHTRGIMVSGAGVIEAVFVEDSTPVNLTVLAGVLYPFAIKRINFSNTDATGIVGFR